MVGCSEDWWQYSVASERGVSIGIHGTQYVSGSEEHIEGSQCPESQGLGRVHATPSLTMCETDKRKRK